MTKTASRTASKKESLTEIPQNKEIMPGNYSSGSGSASRGRGRPKGSKNKTFPVSETRVYSVREGKSTEYSPKKEDDDDDDQKNQNEVPTPNRGRGRPKGSTKQVIMDARKTETSSKRKRSTPQKLKQRKLFVVSDNDLIESDQEDNQVCLNKTKTASPTAFKKESLTETPQNKENMPEKYSSGSGSANRGRGRPKGSKNKTFPVSATRVYSVREGKSPVYSTRKDSDLRNQNGVPTPNRGRGRPKGSTKVKPVGDDVPKKSRGRPKGSKNKKPTKAALLAALMKLTPEIPKAGRGSPRKLPLKYEGDGPKRERGRPKGSLNKNSRKKLAIAVGIREKGNWGRPKNMVLHHLTVMPLTPKRPRGRPKRTGNLVSLQSDLLKRSENYRNEDEDVYEIKEEEDEYNELDSDE